MKRWNQWIALGLLCAPLSLPVLADDLDVTVSVVGADDSAEDAVNEIALPEGAIESAKTAAEFGLKTANAARDKEHAESEIESRDADRLTEDDVKAIVAEARAHSDEARANAEVAAAAARENADAAREAAEEALKNALSGADLQGSMNNLQDILDNLPDDVKAHLPEDLDTIIEDVLDHAQERPTGE